MELMLWLVFAAFLFVLAAAELIWRLLNGESPLRALRRWLGQLFEILLS
jgi:hypothetical protein